MLYDVEIITWLRREHHILGVLIGTLPQVPSQNVFLGLPVELMPEEARLLVEKGLGYIVHDPDWHKASMKSLDASLVQTYKQHLQQKGQDAFQSSQTHKEQRTQAAIRKLYLDDAAKKTASAAFPSSEKSGKPEKPVPSDEAETICEVDNLKPAASDMVLRSAGPEWAVSPAATYPPLPAPQAPEETYVPVVDESQYALFKHLNDEGYYVSPGLRFGCQYMAYPGDPLRFHSHFLAVSANLDEELDLLDIIGGGRLGTGVKKGFVLGGIDIESRQDKEVDSPIKAFSLEWAGM